MMKKSKRKFFLHIILPTILAVLLFTISIFTIIIPTFEQNILDRKREMIREITNSAWSILDEFHRMEQDGLLTREDAQEQAKIIIEYLRYGAERKDYFWLTDMQPVMIIHPYRPELNNTDLSDYSDPAGKRLFVEFVKVVRADGQGYVDYMWQWKDDPTRIVPKLSFVKGFEPWGWIIGTGIYIEDVKEEIDNLTRHLMSISLAILLVLALILFYVSQQSLSIDRERQKAESGLRESEAKYRVLVEAATEGLVMLLDGEFVYANKTLLNMLGYHDQTYTELDLEEILCSRSDDPADGACYFRNLKNEGIRRSQFETQLQTRDGHILNVILFTSEIALEDKQGFTIIVKDVSFHKQIEEELGQSRAEFQTLIDNIDIGLLRAAIGRNYRIIEANQSATRILGFPGKEELVDTNLLDLFHLRADEKAFLKKLTDSGVIESQVVQIKRKDGNIAIISISAVLVKDENGEPLYCDGVIDDITERIKQDEERENLIVELQTSLRFLNEPIAHFVKNLVTCNMGWPIYKVAKLMTRRQYSAVLITTEAGEYTGIVTDRDLRIRVVAENYDGHKPVYEIMSSPIISIRSNALVFHALLFMHQKNVRHLAVRNSEENIIGIISSEELLNVHRHSSTYLLHEIETAELVEDLILSHQRLPRLVKASVDSGAKPVNTTRIITSIFDAILNRLMEFALQKMGEPPAEFAFLALGSGGRRELNLISDQDNALVYADVPSGQAEQVQEYFLKLSQMVCGWLADCGYILCKGEAMAMNPRWCQPLSQWQDYFHTWITQSSPQDLIDLSIFFDFRCVYGNQELTDQLRQYLFKTAAGQAGFMQHLTRNSLQHKPPVGLLGRIVVESGGEHPETFDIKNATLFLIDYARIYAIREKIAETNTLERLSAILSKGVINKTTYDELVQAYNFLMQLRFKHHSTKITNNETADNFINPNSLTQIERNTLRHTFSQITSIQKKLSYDFSGEAI